MNKKEFQELIIKFHAGEANKAENALIEHWYWLYNEDEPETGLTDDEIEAARLEVYQRLPQPILVKNITRPFRPLLVTASVIIVLFVTGFFYFSRARSFGNDYRNDIQPGGNKAVLILSTGVSYDLSNTKEGEVAVDHGVKIAKIKDGQLLFKTSTDPVFATPSNPRDSISELVGLVNVIKPVKDQTGFNTLRTPNGGQYYIGLSDGTGVWLNAGSVLRFPSTFDGLAERRVQLTGEAYFEVYGPKTVIGMKKRAQRKPFIVQTDTQEIMVMGTKFNVNTYDEGTVVKTTLVEGSVKVSLPTEELMIKPGEVAVNNGSFLKAFHADVTQTIAWKNGIFMFEREPLERIMIRVARWYNVKVVYTDQQLKGKGFTGTISKFSHISEVLNILRATGEIKFKVENRIVTISK